MADRRWRVKAPSRLEWRSWGNQGVVFHVESGDTHLLDLVASEGLRCLQTESLDRSQLCRKLAERLDIEADNQLAHYVDSLITRFDEAGLLETVVV